jgi:hypothetical protein
MTTIACPAHLGGRGRGGVSPCCVLC